MTMHFFDKNSVCVNRKDATVNKALNGSMHPVQKLVHSVFGNINYGGLKHNSLYLGLVLPSGGWHSLIHFIGCYFRIGLFLSFQFIRI